MTSQPMLLIQPLFSGHGAKPAGLIELPAEQLVLTEFTPGSDRIPTLVTIERVFSRLSAMGLFPSDSQQGEVIGEVIHRSFYPLPPEEWQSQPLELRLNRVEDDDSAQIVSAIEDLRQPTLRASPAILDARACNQDERVREQESTLVQSLTGAAVQSASIWRERWTTALKFLGRTLLSFLVGELIGLPLADLIRPAIGGALRVV